MNVSFSAHAPVPLTRRCIKKRWWFLGGGLIALAGTLVIAIVGGFVLLHFVGGSVYRNNTGARAKLQRMCDPYRVVPVALEEQRHKHGGYPKEFSDLDPALPHATAAKAAMVRHEGFNYGAGDGTGYSL